ncbi:MAG: aldehyde dehydrogenase family protein [Propionibacteriaceae bacterium]|nr:aldehyde dehydrogenase family protein [Propionibacteriaceae bacterium]
MTATMTPATMTVRRPFDNGFHGDVEVATPHDVRVAAATAGVAQAEWADTPVRERAAVFKRLASLILRDRDRILDSIQDESGKARLNAFEEVMDAARGVRVFANTAASALAEQRRPGAIPVLTRTVERHVPVGVVGMISPWNYPFNLPATDSAQALLAGNAVVLKPDSQTPFTALLLADLLAEAGLPAGLFQVVPGPGAQLGPTLVDSCDYLMFTGSTAVGRELAQACARRLIGFSAELGGKNAALVLADADLAAAASGLARGCFAGAGQVCVSIERIYVANEVYGAFLTQFAARTRALRLQVGHDWDADLGSLVSAKQLQQVTRHVDDARAQGAGVLIGGRPRPDIGPFCYEPTILTGVTESMQVCREETFGPVVSVYGVDSEAEAIARANDSSYGLNASVWSRRRGEEVARRLRAGTVNINESYAAAFGSHAAPMGGMGESGQGRRHGASGLLKYTESQTIARQRLARIAPPDGVSNRAFAEVLSRGIAAMNRVL